jgi:hypothetical protein
MHDGLFGGAIIGLDVCVRHREAPWDALYMTYLPNFGKRVR